MESKTDREIGMERLKNRAADNDIPDTPDPETDQQVAPVKMKAKGIVNIEHKRKE
jgi:hypothetical protein